MPRCGVLRWEAAVAIRSTRIGPLIIVGWTVFRVRKYSSCAADWRPFCARMVPDGGSVLERNNERATARPKVSSETVRMY